MHGVIRNTYHRLISFKDVTPQASFLVPFSTAHCTFKRDHRRTVATFIREQTEALKEDHSDPSESPDDPVSIWSNIDIGSRLKPVSFSMLEQEMSQDPAFGRFHVKFSAFLSQFLTAHNYDLPNGKPLRFDGTPGNIQGEGRKTNLGAILCKVSCSEAPARR